MANKKKHSIIAGVLFGFLGACTAMAPEVQSPLTDMSPVSWKDWDAPNANPNLSWSAFEDPTLMSLMEKGLADSLTIQNAQLRLQNSELSLIQTSSIKSPSIRASGSENLGGSFDSDDVFDYTSLSLSASYEVDLWGKNQQQIDLAKLSIQSSNINLQSARISLAANIADTYFRIRALDKNIALKRQSLIKAQEQRMFVVSRLNVGRAIRADLDRQEVLIARLEASIENTNASRISLVHNLAILLGEVPEGFNLPVNEVDMKPAPIFLANAPLETLRNRPDIKQAEIGLANSNIQADLVRKTYYPTLGLSASVSTSGTLKTVFDTISKPWDVLLNAAYPIFDAGAFDARQKQSVLDQQLALNNYKSSILRALSDIETALSNQESVLRQKDIFDREKAAQERVSAETLAKYNSGRASAVDLLLDENALIAVQEGEVNIWLSMNLSSISLLRAIGVDPKA